MTKYVLNSGSYNNYPEKARLFFNEICDGLHEKPVVLHCFFSRPRDYWESNFAELNSDYYPDGITPIFEMAMPEQFEEQCGRADVIMLHGGDDHLLMYWLRRFDVPEIFKSKVVAGSSAGSDAMSSSFWTCDWRKCIDGLDIVPIKIIPHYKSSYGQSDPRGSIDWDAAYDELAAYGDTTLPIHALEEGDFVVIEQ